MTAHEKQPYRNIRELIQLIPGDDFRRQLTKILDDNLARFQETSGSSHNHQAWRGGYLDHVTEAMNIAVVLYPVLDGLRPLDFTLSDALLVLFAHDIEKPWKVEMEFKTKKEREEFRFELLYNYDVMLSPEHINALCYVEGEGDDYTNKNRVMGSLAAFCHLCDITSARIWFDCPVAQDLWKR